MENATGTAGPLKRPRSDEEEEYCFKVSLPNGTDVTLTLFQSPEYEMPVLDFVKLVKNEYLKDSSSSRSRRREIMWNNPDIYLEAEGIKMRKLVVFKCFPPKKNRSLKKCHCLLLRDGVDEAISFKHHTPHPSPLCVGQPPTPRSPIDNFVGRDDVPSPSSNKRMSLLNNHSVSSVVSSIVNRGQVLQNDVDEAGIHIGELEKKLVLLNKKKRTIEQGICDLQALLHPGETPLDYYMNDKEQIERRIEEKVNTAASVISDMVKISQSQGLQTDCMKDIIGIVAVLGTVADTSLSRIFAEYLGEDNMLAVVCKSYATANALEQYEEHGRVDREGEFYQIATELGKPINRRFLVICLEEISPYTGKIEKLDRQRMLDLPKPLLATGKVPRGFLDYAVNMINLDVHCMDMRTTRGHGLRETLFYLLFGELQVYETREYLKKARSCIKHGAISLDGGIMKGNGVLSLGSWEPEICFPVEPVNVRKEIADMKEVVEATSIEIGRVCQALREELLEFQRKRDTYENFMKASEGQFVNVKIEKP